MKIAKHLLEQMIREEMTSYLGSLLEDKGDEPGLEDASSKKDKSAPKKKPDEKKPEDKGDSKKKTPLELEVPEDSADDELSDEVADGESEEDADDVTGGEIADQVDGKTIQSITMEPKSKILPGAQEIVLTFREIPDPLKILVLKNGQVKFFLKGVHNKL